jgi:NTE family protein
MRTRAAFGLSLLLLAGSQGLAQTPPGAATADRPRLALALSGGGARGIAHIGALRALEEAGIPVDAVAGTSMGAVVGSIYATGRTATELEQIVLSLDWASLSSGRPDRRDLPLARRPDRYAPTVGVDFDWRGVRLPAGLVAEHRINSFLIEHLASAGYAAGGDFDRLPVRFRCVATALDDGARVVLASGDLPRAVRASMSIPLLLPPVDWKGRPLVDGLVTDNLPVDVAGAFGAAVVLAVDVSSPELEPSEYATALGVVSQVSDLLTQRRNADFAQKADVEVCPDLGKHSSTDYSGFSTLIERGYEATRQAIPEIRRRLDEAGVRGEIRARPAMSAEDGAQLVGAPTAEVVVRGNQRLDERLLRRLLNIGAGRPLSLVKALEAFDRVQATGLLSRVWMEFERVGQGVRVVLDVREAPPNRVEIAAAYTEWERARGAIRLRNRSTLGFGEETELLLAASDAETGGRLSLRGERLFVAGLGYRVSAFALDDKPRFFGPEGDEIGRATFERRGVDARLQIPLHRWGLLEAGLRDGHVRVLPRVGIEDAGYTDQTRVLSAALSIDRLDDLLWPEAGGRLALSGQWSLKELGASQAFWLFQARASRARPVGRRLTVQLEGLLGLSGGDPPVYDEFRLGGPFLVPGYHAEELRGPQALAASASVRCRVVGPLRLLVRAGAGDVYATPADVGRGHPRWGLGVGAVVPSGLGPVALEWGVHDGGDTLVSLSLGWN